MRNNNGQFSKGNSGRPKGAQNKNTKELKQLIGNFVFDNLESMQGKFEELEAKDQIRMMIDLIKIIIPKNEPEQEERPQPMILNVDEIIQNMRKLETGEE
ncbi:MAG: hypothetical protein JSS94_03490 [Bacteroidetes bacterium]|nr:hypothetical protein [Bacteroidota bacterium]